MKEQKMVVVMFVFGITFSFSVWMFSPDVRQVLPFVDRLYSAVALARLMG